MEAKELMIGDWVINKDEPTRVNYLNGIKIGTENEYFIEYCECAPITLTDDILRANGFDVEGHHSMLYVNNDELDEVSIHIDYAESYDIDSPCYRLSGICQYVHELQHALRLCGLSELADNFKIE